MKESKAQCENKDFRHPQAALCEIFIVTNLANYYVA